MKGWASGSTRACAGVCCEECVLVLLACTAAFTVAAEASPAPAPTMSTHHMITRLFDEMASMRGEMASLQSEVAELREQMMNASADGFHTDSRRGLQRSTAAAADQRAVRIYTRTMTRQGPDRGLSTRGRRMQAQRRCKSSMDLQSRNAEVTAACCNEEHGDDCSNGAPATCDIECANVLLPFWDDCERALSSASLDTAAAIEAVVEECQSTIVARESESLAVQLMLSCTDGVSMEDCVPPCSADLHGDLLLANIDGEDSKYSCEMHHSTFSWMGAASDGGYLGEDVLAFLSSLLSGAAGAYVLTLVEDAEIHTDVTIHPSMKVHIYGDVALQLAGTDGPHWGAGSFLVQQLATLGLIRVALDDGAQVRVVAGGSLILAHIHIGMEQLSWEEKAGSTLSLTNVSFGITQDIAIGDYLGCFEDHDSQRDFAILIATDLENDLEMCAERCLGYTYFATQYGRQCFCDNEGPSYERAPEEDCSMPCLGNPDQMCGGGYRNSVYRLPPPPPQLVITQTYTVGSDGHTLTGATDNAVAWQCYEPYNTLRTDMWRRPTGQFSHPSWHCDDSPTCDEEPFHTDGIYRHWPDDILSDNPPAGWTRLGGQAGDAIATQPTPFGDCGTGFAFYAPYAIPQTAEGRKPVAFCVAAPNGDAVYCGSQNGGATLRQDGHAVNCGTFLLWDLPYRSVSEGETPWAYCVEPSGLPPDNSWIPEPPNFAVGRDCDGEFQDCSENCEVAADRIWQQTVSPTGDGAPCPEPTHCHVGDGMCEAGSAGDGACDLYSDAMRLCSGLEGLEYKDEAVCGTPCVLELVDCVDSPALVLSRAGIQHLLEMCRGHRRA